jgi:Branched-chain amino acid aminotransferase/4-amino-4-deoxychorismate lyase
MGVKVTERSFTVAEAKAAAEAFLTSTTPRCCPVTRIDGHVVGNGRPGELALRLLDRYRAYAAGPGLAP